MDRGAERNQRVIRNLSGASGILATADGFTLEDLAIEDTKGDALKVNNSNGVTIRRVRTEWTGGPKETNGSYGIYPVHPECWPPPTALLWKIWPSRTPRAMRSK